MTQREHFYRSALHDDVTVMASDVRFRKRDFTSGFKCIGCGREMIARTDGRKQSPHFAHRVDQSGQCSYETYLHKLAKRQFVDLFQNRVSRQQPLWLELWHPTHCCGYNNPFFDGCVLQNLRNAEHQNVTIVRHDLVRSYQIVGVEQAVNGFVADVLLARRDEPTKQLLVEFLVTHESSEAKRNSGLRMIELKITDESSVERLLSQPLRIRHPIPQSTGHLGTPGTSAYNLHPGLLEVSPTQCGCVSGSYRLFVVYTSGKAFLEKGTLPEVSEKFKSLQLSIAHWRLYFSSPDRHDYSFIEKENYVEKPNETYSRAALDIHEVTPTFQNCVLCHYRRNDKYRGKALYCVKYRQAFDSNSQGAKCEVFTPKDFIRQ